MAVFHLINSLMNYQKNRDEKLKWYPVKTYAWGNNVTIKERGRK